jgi:hypothetical protein
MASEEWRQILGYEGLYEISNLGRVKSSLHNFEKILKPSLNRTGHLVVNLSKKGTGKTFLVHRLVAMSFIDNEQNYKDIDHIDQNPSNNHVSNLRWASRSLNCANSKIRINNKSSIYNGVSWCRQTKKWKSSIWHNHSVKCLGRFNDETTAARVYNEYCKLHKLDRVLNLI